MRIIFFFFKVYNTFYMGADFLMDYCDFFLSIKFLTRLSLQFSSLALVKLLLWPPIICRPSTQSEVCQDVFLIDFFPRRIVTYNYKECLIKCIELSLM